MVQSVKSMISRRSAIAGLAAGIGVPEALLTSASPQHRPTRVRASSETTRGGAEVNLADYGVSPHTKPHENLARFKKAVANTPEGATLYLPSTGSLACVIDTSGGWPDAICIDRPITLRIDGNLKASHSALRPNPPFMLNITAPGVTISGTGRIIGDGTTDDTNTGIDETLPGLVRVAADNFTMTGIEIVSPPKIGLMLYQCHRARIENARFSGGPKVYGDTGHFAIRAAGGGHHLFKGNQFYPSSDGGMCVQCIMLSGSHDNVFSDNHALHPYEKLIYGYGDRNVAHNNVVDGNPNFIPGTNVQGTITAVFRFHGSFNTVRNNHTNNCAGGAQMMDGTGHQVIDNKFLRCGQSAITAYQCNLSQSTFKGNIGTRANLMGFVAGDGMRLVSDAGAAHDVIIENNEISGFSVTDPIVSIATWRKASKYGRNSVIRPSGNNGGRFYSANNSGTSGRAEPKWPSTPGATIKDGTIIWTTNAYEGEQAEIKLLGKNASMPITESIIQNNTTRGGRYGIITQFVERSRITGNRLEASEWGMIEEAGRHNRWQSNAVQGAANKRVRTLSATSATLSKQ